MDRQALAQIAARARVEEAARLGLPVTAFSAVAAVPPALPNAPRWFDIAGADLAVSPDCSYQLVVEALRKAKKRLLLYIYNISAPYLFDELSAALARGVDVRVMYDANDGGADEGKELKKRNIPHLVAPATKPARTFTVCHQKFAVIDNKGILIESANWAPTSIPKRPAGAPYKIGNREWVMWAPGEELAGWFADLFDDDWKRSQAGGHAVGLLPQIDKEAIATSVFAAVPPTQFAVKKVSAGIKVFPLISPNNYGKGLIPHLKAAKTSICVQQQYIVAGEGVDDLLEVLEDRRKKGVEIRLLVSPKYPKKWEESVDTLKAANLGMCLRAQNLEYVVHGHNKGVIIDDTLSVVSSTNWSENSVTRGREAGLLVESKDAAAYFQSVFDFDWKVSVAVDDVPEKFALVPVDEEF